MASTPRLKVTEKQIQDSICQYLDLRGILYSVTDASRSFGPDGKPRRSKVSKDWPDISAVITRTVLGQRIGQAFFIECKSEKGKLSEGQTRQLEALGRAGAICLVARSVEDVQAVLSKYLRA